jgi:hypothetical protein
MRYILKKISFVAGRIVRAAQFVDCVVSNCFCLRLEGVKKIVPPAVCERRFATDKYRIFI